MQSGWTGRSRPREDTPSDYSAVAMWQRTLSNRFSHFVRCLWRCWVSETGGVLRAFFVTICDSSRYKLEDTLGVCPRLLERVGRKREESGPAGTRIGRACPRTGGVARAAKTRKTLQLQAQNATAQGRLSLGLVRAREWLALTHRMEARGIEPRSRDGSGEASTCVVDLLNLARPGPGRQGPRWASPMCSRRRTSGMRRPPRRIGTERLQPPTSLLIVVCPIHAGKDEQTGYVLGSQCQVVIGICV